MDARSSRQLWLTLVAVGLSTLLALWSAWPIYATPRMVLAGALGALIGAGVAVLSRARGWNAWGSAGLAATGFMLAAVPLASPSSMGSPSAIGRGTVDVLAAAVLDWKRLLTISVPVGDYQTLLVPFLVVMVGGSWAAITLSFAKGRLWTLAVLPMLGMVAFGALFGAATAGRTVMLGPLTVPAAAQVALAGAALLVCGAWLIGRARLDRSDSLRLARSQSATVRTGGRPLALALRRRLGAYGLIGAAALGGLAFVPVTDMLGTREALRESVLPPEVISAQTSPLTVYRGWFADDLHDETLLTAAGDVAGQRLRLATLDSYDGQTFHVDALSAEFARQPTTQEGTITVTIGPAYSGIWVPLATTADGAPTFGGDRADALTDSYYADVSLDTAVVVPGDDPDGGLQPGDTYTVAAAVLPTADALSTVSGGEPTVTEEQYPALAAWVDQQGLGRTGADLTELLTRLQDRGYLSHAAREDGAEAWISDLSSRAPYTFEPVRSGHTSARVDAIFQNLLEQELRAGTGADQAALVAAVGDDEQFAAAGAVLARYLGFDSRVVVGVRLGAADPTDGVPACDGVCTGANVTAWVEVRVGDGAWAPLDVTPQFVLPPTRIRQGESLPENATEVDEPSSEVIEPPSAQRDEATSDTSTTEPEAQETPVVVEAMLVILTLGLAVLLLLAPLLALPVAKVLRRRWRRRQTHAEVSMVGAWEELVDAYADAGFEVPDRLTRGELADLVDREAALTVAYVVDGAVFAEHPPTQEQSDAVWAIVEDERRDLAASMAWRKRLGARLSPASLVRRARGERAAGPLLAHPGRRADALR